MQTNNPCELLTATMPVGSGDLLDRVNRSNNVFNCKIYLLSAFLCAHPVILNAGNNLNQLIKPTAPPTSQVALYVFSKPNKFGTLVSEGALFVELCAALPVQPINFFLPCPHKNQEISPPLALSRNPISVFGEQVINESNKQRTEKPSTYGYQSWNDLAYDFLSHFISGVVGASAMLWWCKRSNKESAALARSNTVVLIGL
jgi:hypothetical protein